MSKYLNRNELAEKLKEILCETSSHVINRFSGGGAYESSVPLLKEDFLREAGSYLVAVADMMKIKSGEVKMDNIENALKELMDAVELAPNKEAAKKLLRKISYLRDYAHSKERHYGQLQMNKKNEERSATDLMAARNSLALELGLDLE